MADQQPAKRDGQHAATRHMQSAEARSADTRSDSNRTHCEQQSSADCLCMRVMGRASAGKRTFLQRYLGRRRKSAQLLSEAPAALAGSNEPATKDTRGHTCAIAAAVVTFCRSETSHATVLLLTTDKGPESATVSNAVHDALRLAV
jgi:hypothetical protein